MGAPLSQCQYADIDGACQEPDEGKPKAYTEQAEMGADRVDRQHSDHPCQVP